MSERRSEQQLGRRPERRDAGATPPSIAIAALVLGGPESARARARCVFYSSSSSSGLDYRYCPHVLAAPAQIRRHERYGTCQQQYCDDEHALTKQPSKRAQSLEVPSEE